MRSCDQLFSCIDTIKLCPFREAAGEDLISSISVFPGSSRGTHRKCKFIVSFSASIIAFHRSRKLRHRNHRSSIGICHRIRHIISASPVCNLLLHLQRVHIPRFLRAPLYNIFQGSAGVRSSSFRSFLYSSDKDFPVRSRKYHFFC